MVKRYKPDSNVEREIYNFVRHNFGIELERDAFGLDVSVLSKKERVKISKDSNLGKKYKDYEQIYTARKKLNLPIAGVRRSKPLSTTFDRVANARRLKKVSPRSSVQKKKTTKLRSGKTKISQTRIQKPHRPILFNSKTGRYEIAEDDEKQNTKKRVNRPKKRPRPIEEEGSTAPPKKRIKKSRQKEMNIDVPDLSLKKLRAGRVQGVPAIIAMVDKGRFDDVIGLSILAKDAHKLDIKDFVTADPYGILLIDLLVNRGELEKAFDPRLWQGRTDKMRYLWENILQKDDRKNAGFDFEAKMSRAILLTRHGRTPQKTPRLK